MTDIIRPGLRSMADILSNPVRQLFHRFDAALASAEQERDAAVKRADANQTVAFQAQEMAKEIAATLSRQKAVIEAADQLVTFARMFKAYPQGLAGQDRSGWTDLGDSETPSSRRSSKRSAGGSSKRTKRGT